MVEVLEYTSVSTTQTESVLLHQTSIDVIVPAYNEEETVVKTLQKISGTLGRTTHEFRLIVVDDGSRDGTAGRIKEYGKTAEGRMLTFVRNGRNAGKGAAIRRASEFVNGDVVAILDADLEIDPKQLELYIDALKSADMCIASKRHPNSVYGARAWRKVLSVGFNKLVRIATGLKESDTQAGLKVVKSEFFRQMVAPVVVKRYAFDVEMLLVAKLLKMNVVQLPVKVEQDSGFRFIELINMLRDLVGIAYRLRVTKWYQRALVEGLREQ